MSQQLKTLWVLEAVIHERYVLAEYTDEGRKTLEKVRKDCPQFFKYVRIEKIQLFESQIKEMGVIYNTRTGDPVT